jgi:4-diphosphocytidyl-2-C-methyl-D-erythritol kinase
MQNFTTNCPAKINLFLKVTGKRPTGYHELESLFAFLDLADVLEVKKSTEFSLKIDGEFAEFVDEKNNLFTKILDFFVAEFAIDKNISIHVTKNIPVGAGLGGGSSNAAFFMKALNEIFSLNLSKEKLQEISLNFGSDIAFLLEDNAAIVKGRGEIIAPFYKFYPIKILLINPKINLSTPAVFKQLNGEFSEGISTEELQKKSVFELIKNFPNDLTKPAVALAPTIQEILNELKNAGAEIAKMSGSGSTCFGIFDDDLTLEKAETNLREKFPKFFITKTKVRSHA